MTDSYLMHLNGYDIFYKEGCFTLDPMPDLCTLQAIVSYLIAEGFIQDENF
jgi:hypothetical protein